MSDDDLDDIMNWADDEDDDYGSYGDYGGGLLRGGRLRRTDEPPPDYDGVQRDRNAEVDLPPAVADDDEGAEELKEAQKELDAMLQEVAKHAADGESEGGGPSAEEQEDILQLKLSILRGVRQVKEQAQWGTIKNRLFKPEWYIAKELRGTSYSELEHKTLVDLGDSIEDSRRAIHRLVHDNLDTFIEVKDVVDTVYVSDRELFKGVTTAALVSAYRTATNECKRLLEKPFLANLSEQRELHGTWELFNDARDLIGTPLQVYSACGLEPLVPGSDSKSRKRTVSESILEQIYERFKAAPVEDDDRNPFHMASRSESPSETTSDENESDSSSADMTAPNHVFLKEVRREMPQKLLCCNDVLLLPTTSDDVVEVDNDDDGSAAKAAIRDQLRGYQSAAQSVRKCVMHLDEHYSMIDGVAKGSNIASRRARKRAEEKATPGLQEEADAKRAPQVKRNERGMDEDPLLGFLKALAAHDPADGDRPTEPHALTAGSDAELERKQFLLQLYLDERRFVFRFCVSLLSAVIVLMESIHCALKVHVLGPDWREDTEDVLASIDRGRLLGSGASDTVFIEDVLSTWMDVSVASVKIRHFSLQLQRRLRDAEPVLKAITHAIESRRERQASLRRGASGPVEGSDIGSNGDMSASSGMSDSSAASSVGSSSSFASSSLLSTDSLFETKQKKKRKRTKDRVRELQQRTLQLKSEAAVLLSGAQRAVQRLKSTGVELRTSLPPHPVETFLDLLNGHHRQRISSILTTYSQCLPAAPKNPAAYSSAFERLCRSLVAPCPEVPPDDANEDSHQAYVGDERLTTNLYRNQADLPVSPFLSSALGSSTLLAEVAGIRRRVFIRGQGSLSPRTVANCIPLFDRQTPVMALFSDESCVVADTAAEASTNAFIAHTHPELFSTIHSDDSSTDPDVRCAISVGGVAASSTWLVVGTATIPGVAATVAKKLNDGSCEAGTYADEMWGEEVRRVPEILSQQAASFHRHELKRKQEERIRIANAAAIRRRQQLLGADVKSVANQGVSSNAQTIPSHPSAAVLALLDSILRTTTDTVLTYWTGIGSSAIHKGTYDYAPAISLPVLKETWGPDITVDEEEEKETDVVGSMCVSAVVPVVALAVQPPRGNFVADETEEHDASSSSSDDGGGHEGSRLDVQAAYEAVDDADTIESVVQVSTRHIRNVVQLVNSRGGGDGSLTARATVVGALKAISKEEAVVRRGDGAEESALRIQVLQSLIPRPTSVVSNDCTRPIPCLNYVPVSNLPELVECARNLVVCRDKRVAAERKAAGLEGYVESASKRLKPRKEARPPSAIPPPGRSLRSSSILVVLQMLCRCADAVTSIIRNTISHNIQHGILKAGESSSGKVRAAVVLELFIALWERMAVRVCDFIIEVKSALVTPSLAAVGMVSTAGDAGTGSTTLQFLSQDDGEAILVLLQQLESMRSRTLGVLQVGIALGVRAHLAAYAVLSSGLELSDHDLLSAHTASLRKSAGGFGGNNSFGQSVLGGGGDASRGLGKTNGATVLLGSVTAGAGALDGARKSQRSSPASLESEKRLFTLRQRLSPFVLCTDGPVHVLNLMTLIMDRLMDVTLRHYELADGQANVYFNVLPLLEAARFASSSKGALEGKAKVMRRRRAAADATDVADDDTVTTASAITASTDVLYQSSKDVSVLLLLRKATEALAVESVHTAQRSLSALMLDVITAGVDSVVLKAVVSGTAHQGPDRLRQPVETLGAAAARALVGNEEGVRGDVEIEDMSPGELLAYRGHSIAVKHRQRLLLVESIADIFCLAKLVLPMMHELLLGSELWRGLAHICIIHTKQDDSGPDGSRKGLTGKASGALLKEIEEHVSSTRVAYASGEWFTGGGSHPKRLISIASHGAIHQLLNRLVSSVTSDILDEVNVATVAISDLDWMSMALSLMPCSGSGRYVPDIHPTVTNVRPYLVDALVHVARAHDVLFRMVPPENVNGRAEQLPQLRGSKKGRSSDATSLAANIVIYAGLAVQRMLSSIGKGVVAALTASGRITVNLPIVPPPAAVIPTADAPLSEVEGSRSLLNDASAALSESGMATQLFGYLVVEAELQFLLAVMDELARNMASVVGGEVAKRGARLDVPDELIHPDMRHMLLVLPALVSVLKERGVQACEQSQKQFRLWEQQGTGEAPPCLAPKDRESLVIGLTQQALRKNVYLVKAVACLDPGVQSVISQARQFEALRSRAEAERVAAVKAARAKALAEIVPVSKGAIKETARPQGGNDAPLPKEDLNNFYTAASAESAVLPKTSKAPVDAAAVVASVATVAHSSSDADSDKQHAEKKTKKRKKRKHKKE